MWESNEGILDYYLHMPTDRGSVYFRDYVSRTDAVTTIPGTRPYNGTTVPVDRPTLGADGLRGCGVVDNLIPGTAPTDLTQWTGAKTSILQNQVSAPYGTDLADKICANSDTDSQHFIRRSGLAVDDNKTYKYSVYVKADDFNWCCIVTYSKAGSASFNYFNLSTGAAGATSSPNPSISRLSTWEEGWYLISVDFPTASGAASPGVYVYLAENDSDLVLNGIQTGKGIYAWGAQVTASTYKLYDNFTGSATVTEAGTTVLPLTAGMSEAMGSGASATLTATWKPMFDSGDIAAGVVYESDFSAGVDSFVASTGGAVAGNIDSIGGESDWLRFTVDALSSVHTWIRSGSPLVVGKQYHYAAKYFLPSTNNVMTFFSIWNSTGATRLLNNINVVDAATPISFDFTATTTGHLRYYGQGGNTFQDLSGDDVIYIKDIVITEIYSDTLLSSGNMSLKYIAGLDQLEFSDGTNTATKSLTCVAETAYAITAKWDGVNSLMKIGVDGVYGTETAFTGSFSPGNMTFLSGSQFQWIDDVDILKVMSW